jgi:uncharacterized protein YydD (DUF2326 family)
MSDIPADYRDRLDLRSVIAEIDRKRAETQKLQEEREKLIAEQHKLLAEGNRYNRDKWIGIVVAAIIARLPEILHALRVGAP